MHISHHVIFKVNSAPIKFALCKSRERSTEGRTVLQPHQVFRPLSGGTSCTDLLHWSKFKFCWTFPPVCFYYGMRELPHSSVCFKEVFEWRHVRQGTGCPEGGVKVRMEVCSSFILEAKAAWIGNGKKWEQMCNPAMIPWFYDWKGRMRNVNLMQKVSGSQESEENWYYICCVLGGEI